MMKFLTVMNVMCFCFLLSMCQDHLVWTSVIDNIQTQSELSDEFGVPDYSKQLILTKNTSLYEYQGNLWKYTQYDGKESILVVENSYESIFYDTYIWYIPLEGDSLRIIDNISYIKYLVEF